MSGTDLESTVRHVVARQLRVPPDDLTGEMHLMADLGIDASTAFELLDAVGDALDVMFPDDFLDGVHTYGDLTTAVRVSLAP